MTRHESAGSRGLERWHDRGAYVVGFPASCAEPATRRRVDRTRHIAFEEDAAALSLGARNCAQDSDTAERAGIVRVVVLIAALAAYAWLLPRVGFIVCTIALLVLMLRGLGRVGWLWTSVSAVTGTVACYVLFTRLGLPLPDGLLGF